MKSPGLSASFPLSPLSFAAPRKPFSQSSYRDFASDPMVKTSPAGGAVSIPGLGAKIPHASQAKDQNIKQKQYCNKFNKDFKTGPHQQTIKRKITSCRGCFSGLETPQAL